MSTYAIAVLLSLSGATPGEDIAEKIVSAGHSKVGVIPSVISRKGTKEATVGSIGPRAVTLAKDVQNQLITLSTSGKYRGKFTVVSERVMRNAINEVAKNRPLQVDDLGNPKALKALSNYTGAKGFVTLGIDEPTDVESADIVDSEGKNKPDSDTTTNAKDDKGKKDDDDEISKRPNAQKIEASFVNDEGDEFHNDTYRDVNTLSKSAYMGDSFEVRRWRDNELLNLGLQSNHPQFAEDSKWQFGLGPKWEREQFQYLKSPLEHPLDIDGFPFRIEIMVGDEIRTPRKLRGKYLVELNPGEEYAVYLENNASQPVAVALYIDGVNSIDRERREPADLEDGRHWALAKDFKAQIGGWYSIDSKLKMQQANKFRIVERSESVAAQKGFDENIGMVTAIFYANDAVSGNFVKYPDDKLLDNVRSVFGDSQFGTGAGDEYRDELKFESVKRGLMLAAVTIYYRSSNEIAAIESGSSEDLVLGGDAQLALGGDKENKDDDEEKKKEDKSKQKKDDEELKFD